MLRIHITMITTGHESKTTLRKEGLEATNLLFIAAHCDTTRAAPIQVQCILSPVNRDAHVSRQNSTTLYPGIPKRFWPICLLTSLHYFEICATVPTPLAKSSPSSTL